MMLLISLRLTTGHNTMPTSITEVANEVTKAAPPLVVQGMQLFGVPISDLVQVVTLGYLVLQIGWFAYSRVKGK